MKAYAERMSRLGTETAFVVLAEVNLALDSDLHRWSVPTIDEAARIAATVLNLPIKKRPTAILGFNDLVAFGAMSAAGSLGLRIPDDVSVIGYGDIYLASHTNPPLTSIESPPGHALADHVLNSPFS